MGLFRIFGWVFLIFGIGIMTAPLISSMTGFVINNLNVVIPYNTSSDIPQPSTTFSLRVFAVGGALSIVGLVIASPKKKSDEK